MSKVLVIGLDGATWDLLKHWVEEGRLPTLKKLMKEGVHGKLRSTIPPLTGPAWVSFATGKNPGKHGCYDFLLPRDGLDDIQTITTRDITGETFYEILDRNGKKCILINLPCSYPPRIKSIVITDFLTVGDEFIFPRKLIEEIPELKEYRVIPKSHSRINEYINDVRDLEQNRFKCAKKLFEKEWDFFFILFSGTDWIQHKIYDKLISGDNLDAIEFYEEIDDYVKWFVENAGDANILIMSDHGFHFYNKKFAINKWLMKEGYLKIKPKKSPESTFREKSQKGVTVPVSLLRHQKIFKLGTFFYRLFRGMLPTTPLIKTEPDTTASIAYSVLSSANGNCCGIYINSKRRFNNGSVEIVDYEKVRGKLMDKLEELRDENGKKIFKSVLKGEDVYFGECVDKAPDIVLISDEYNIASFYDEDKISNEHALNGIFLAYGKDIKEGGRVNVEIIDLAPTVLYMMDIPIPKGMDGRVLQEIFKEDSELAKKGTVYQEVGDEEKRTIKEKIKELKAIGKI